MTPLSKAQIENRKLAVLRAAAIFMNQTALHSNSARDVEQAVVAAVCVAKQMLAHIDSTEQSQ